MTRSYLVLGTVEGKPWYNLGTGPTDRSMYNVQLSNVMQTLVLGTCYLVLGMQTNLGTGPTDRGLRERWLVLLSHLRSSPVQTNKLSKEDILRQSWMKLQIKFTFHIHCLNTADMIKFYESFLHPPLSGQ